jgi:glucans biosynthesis protein C
MKSERINGLDLLRGISMILGIVLHGAIAYKAGYPYGELIHDANAEYFFFDWLHLSINSFRMQLFFLLAGFFYSIVLYRKGTKFLIKNRFTRIVIPLGLAYLTVLPATLLPVVIYQSESQNIWMDVRRFLLDFYTFKKFSGLIHLWFLYDLIIFYVVALLGKSIIEYFKLGTIEFGHKLMKVTGLHLIFACIVAVGIINQLNEAPVITIWTGLRPPVSQLLYYGFFFFLGVLIERNRHLLIQSSNYYHFLLGVSLVLGLINFFLLNFYFSHVENAGFYDLLFRFSLATQTISTVFGLLGYFYLRFPDATDTGIYLSKSAYWVYLVHNPVVLTVQLLLLDSMVPGFLRFPLVIITATSLSYLSYQYLVKDKWIGTLLNGK